MTAENRQLSGTPISASFLSNDPGLHEAFASALAADLKSSQLSWAFKLYYRVRWMIPTALRQLMQRQRSSWADLEKDWYVPRATMEELAKRLSGRAVQIVHPWPNGSTASLVLTHDVETAAGLKLVDRLAKIEEKHGLRSAWNLIPEKYNVDASFVRDLIDRGHEVGVHGYNHDGRLFESEQVFGSRVARINEAAKEFQAVGFRAPMVHRDLVKIVEQLEFDYDASCFDIDPLQAMAGGVGFIWPFIVSHQKSLVELPYTLPQDHTLFVSLGQTDDTIWKSKLDYLRRNSGMAMLLTHPDYLDSSARLDLYDRFLGEALEMTGWWHALPNQVAQWWRVREVASNQLADVGSIANTSSEFGALVPATLSSAGNEVRISLIDRNDHNA